MVSDILIEDFANPLHSWKVAGEADAAGWRMEHGVGILNGGPCATTTTTEEVASPVVDVSSCQGLMIKVKSTGSSSSSSSIRVSFGNDNSDDGFFTAGWQAWDNNSDEWTQVLIPFSHFTANNLVENGNDLMDTTTTTWSCAQDARLCPTTASLQNLQRLLICSQDDVLEIAWIYGAACTAEAATERREEIFMSTTARTHHGGFGASAAIIIVGSVAGCILLLAVLFVGIKKMSSHHHSRYAAVRDNEEHDDTELTLQVWNEDSKLEMEELEWLEDNA
eukprot:scaffold3227_cov214-Amphora_coffeaeformis.AAC.7